MCQVEEMKLKIKCQTPEDPIKLYVMLEKKEKKQLVSIQIGICNSCWAKIGDKNWECGKDPRPTFESLFVGRGLEGAVLTEYKVKEKKGKEQTEDEDEYD